MIAQRRDFFTPRRVDTIELLDRPRDVLDDLGANLRDIRRLNRWFGGTSAALQQAGRLMEANCRVSMLDVATGSADIPLALLRWRRGGNQALRIVASDISGDVLDEARLMVAGEPIELVRADARQLPWGDGAFDYVVCCLAIHHFSPDDAVCVLEEMWRVARRAALVVDLTRSYMGFLGAWLATRTVARNRLTRHDAPLSVLRAYTPSELNELARRAGMANITQRRHRFFRQSLLAWKPERAGG